MAFPDHLLQKLQDLQNEFPALVNQTVRFGENVSIQPTTTELEPKKRPERLMGPSAKIQVRLSPIHGYGIFAVTDIDQDELIEESLLLELGLRNRLISDPVIKDYIFIKSNPEEVHEYGSKVLLGLGYLGIYNHQDEPNAAKKFDFLHNIGRIYARRPILAGEEIVITYGKQYFRNRKIFYGLSQQVQQLILKTDENEKI
ncbi:SET domain-containing protein-lysine N-methyltransferase [Mongoliitalea lutea]|uniref:SET domain-containing protein n=1 Tax=Mongoliitalea lutea TaxID=849756 RepID=A0A8J3CYB2_9BACT|nr:SET domain-containing protein-lysine N-methyltransferase [Mongoliitalea lutea]GHB36959.1 hypothetical protein GCM10008106_17800 [Mongoliitalea lutea]